MLLNEPVKNPKEIIDFLNENKITIDEVILCKNSLFTKSKIKWLIQGNITKEATLELVNEIHKIFEIDINEEKKGKFIISRPVKLTKNYNFIFRAKSPNKEEKNSSIISLYQCGFINDTEIQYLKIVNSFLKEKFYDQLRTKESLGYIVTLLVTESAGSYCLLGLVQSGTKIPEFCSERIRKFIKESYQLVKEINEEEFKSHVNSLIVLEKKKDENLN